MTGTNLGRQWLFRVAAVMLAVVVTLAVMELVAWAVLHKEWPRQPAMPTVAGNVLTGHGARLKPNLDLTQWFIISNQVVNFQTNSMGFRGKREFSLTKPADVLRILFLGDSVTLEAFLPEAETFPAMVEKILSATRKVEVINAAVSGIGLREEVYILKDTGLKMHPDVVVVGFYMNDSRPPWGFEKEYYTLPPWLMESSKVIEQYSYLYKWVWKRLLVHRFMRKNLASIWDWTADYNAGKWRTDQAAYQKVIKGAKLDFGSAWDENSWPVIYSGMDRLQELGKKYNFKPAVVIFPVTMQVRADFYDDFPQQKLLGYCRAHDLPCLDLLPILRAHKDEDLYFDMCHLKALGDQVVAPPIADFLRQVAR